MSMGSHQSARNQTDTWLTPPTIIYALGGDFDLDPCCPKNMPWKTANRMLTKEDDGLSVLWKGRVFLNPPYSKEARVWLDRLAAHGNGIALIFARTETKWFQQSVWQWADGILFLHDRLHFHLIDGTRAEANAGAPSCLVAYGKDNVTALAKSGLKGSLVKGWKNLPR